MSVCACVRACVCMSACVCVKVEEVVFCTHVYVQAFIRISNLNVKRIIYKTSSIGYLCSTCDSVLCVTCVLVSNIYVQGCVNLTAK